MNVTKAKLTRFSTPRKRGAALALACAAGLMLAGIPPALAEKTAGKILKGPAISGYVSGRRIYLAAPFGGELPLFYRADGYVDGSGKAVGLGKTLAPTDTGRWWVRKDKLCQKWQSWYDGRVFCFTLEPLAGNRVRWRRDDGQQGVARIGK